MERHAQKILLLFFTLSACGAPDTDQVVAVHKQIQSPSSSPSTSPPPETLPQKQEPITPKKSPLLLVRGENLLGTHLYTLSSEAEEALPLKINAPPHRNYREVLPLSETKVIAISQEQHTEKYRIELIQIHSSTHYVLYQTEASPLKQLTLSHDKNWIAFVQKNIFLLNLKTEKVFEIAKSQQESPENSQPLFLKDNQHLLFQRKLGTQFSWMKAGFNENGFLDFTELFETKGLSQEAALSPDEQWLLFTSNVGRFAQLLLKPMNRMEEIMLTPDLESWKEPQWSSDGKKILFWKESKEGHHLQVYDLESKKIEILTALNAASGRICPVSSPDLKEIYYTSSAGSWERIYKINLLDKTPHLLINPNLPISFFCPILLPLEGGTQ